MENQRHKDKIVNHLLVYGPLNVDSVAYDLDMHDVYVLRVMTELYSAGLIVGNNVDGFVASKICS